MNPYSDRVRFTVPLPRLYILKLAVVAHETHRSRTAQAQHVLMADLDMQVAMFAAKANMAPTDWLRLRAQELQDRIERALELQVHQDLTGATKPGHAS